MIHGRVTASEVELVGVVSISAAGEALAEEVFSDGVASADSDSDAEAVWLGEADGSDGLGSGVDSGLGVGVAIESESAIDPSESSLWSDAPCPSLGAEVSELVTRDGSEEETTDGLSSGRGPPACAGCGPTRAEPMKITDALMSTARQGNDSDMSEPSTIRTGETVKS